MDLEHIKRLYIITFIFWFISNSAIAQIKNEDKDSYLDADYYFYIKNYKKSLDLLLSIYPNYPDHGNINYLIGACYILGHNDAGKALPYLKKATTDISKDYRPGDLKNSAAPSDAWLFYGDALHATEQFQEASNAYHTYLDYSPNDEITQDLARRRIMGLGISYEGYMRPSPLEVINMGQEFNSEGNDYKPVVSGDGNTMVFTSQRGGTNRIYYSQKSDNAWGQPTDITRELGSDGNFFASSLSFSGAHLFLIKKDGSNSDIYESDLDNGTWGKVVALNKKINSGFNETGACMSSDGKVLFFSSDKPGGFGGIDIYFSESEKGKWSRPQNVESPVNTEFDEDFPVCSATGDTLFFSTNGRESIGRMDIFRTTKSSDGYWEMPENIGVPYNTVENDYLGMYLKPDGEAYLAQLPENGFGDMDIVHITHKKAPLAKRAISDTGAQLAAKPPEPGLIYKGMPQNNVVSTADIPIPQDTDAAYEKTTNGQLQHSKEEAGQQASPGPMEEKKATNTSNQQSETVENIQALEGNDKEGKPGLETKPDIKKENVISMPDDENNFYADRNTSTATFTIQLMALRNPKDKSVIKGIDLSKIHVSAGSDGYTRYTYGRYNSLTEVRKVLLQLEKSGHKNAFIKKISSISNY
jgi:tetratricopeptide (TPR) repeat protein